MPGRRRIPLGPVSVTQVTFGPPPRRAPALLAATLASAAAALFIPEFWALVVVLASWAGRDLWFRRTLELQEEGFHYVAGLRREYATWISVIDVRVRQERHWLSFGKTLEIDLADETLIVLSGAQLGTDPDEVAAIIDTRWQDALRSAKKS
jgi:hypothetical protein